MIITPFTNKAVSRLDIILEALKSYARVNGEEQGIALDCSPKTLEGLAVWANSAVEDYDKNERAMYERLKKRFGP